IRALTRSTCAAASRWALHRASKPATPFVLRWHTSRTLSGSSPTTRGPGPVWRMRITSCRISTCRRAKPCRRRRPQQSAPFNSTAAASRWTLGQCYLELGRPSEAIQDLRRGAALADEPEALARLGAVYGLTGHTQEALGVLEQLRHSAKGRVSPYHEAWVYAGL